MKLAKINACLLVLIINQNFLSAQISIDAGLTQSMFANGGVSSVFFADTWNLDALNGQVGDNQNWDFSSVTWPDTVTYTQLSRSYPSGTLLENESAFQSSTHTFHSSINFLGTELVTDQYFHVSSDAVEILGIAQNADFDGDGDLEEGAFFYTPGEKILSFPLEMGSSWQSVKSTDILANGTQVADLDERITHTVSGWGQANAMGIGADCLRDDIKTEFACASGSGYCGEINQINLYCVPQTDGPLYFYIVFAELNSDGTIGDLILWTFDSSLVLSSASDIPNSLSNIEVYPNPFHDSLDLQFNLDTNGQIEVTVFDLLGQKVGEIANQMMSTGEKSFEWRPASHLPNSTYIVEFKHNGLSTHQKVTLLR